MSNTLHSSLHVFPAPDILPSIQLELGSFAISGSRPDSQQTNIDHKVLRQQIAAAIQSVFYKNDESLSQYFDALVMDELRELAKKHEEIFANVLAVVLLGE